jgi:hypothetical protein
MSILRAVTLVTAPIRPLAVSPKTLVLRAIDALVEADRRYREARRVERLDYPYLKDMGIDLGRQRDVHRR